MADARVLVLDSKITRKPGRMSLAIFIGVLLGGVVYTGGSLLSDLSPLRSIPSFEFVLLGLMLVIAMATILAADGFGVPVSTTHVLTSGAAGTMAANHSGLQWGTLRALAADWLMTLPASVALSGGLFWFFRHVM